MPFELTFADDNNQFLYYNNMMPEEEMLASRRPSQVGNPMAYCHPERARKGAATVVKAKYVLVKEKFRLSGFGNGPINAYYMTILLCMIRTGGIVVLITNL